MTCFSILEVCCGHCTLKYQTAQVFNNVYHLAVKNAFVVEHNPHYAECRLAEKTILAALKQEKILVG